MIPGMEEIHPLDKPGIRAEIMAILGVSPQVISNWKYRGTPVEYCYELEQKTSGRITRQELRPADCWRIWPDLAHLAPAASKADRAA